MNTMLLSRYAVVALACGWLTGCGSKAPQSAGTQRTEVALPFADHKTDQEAFRGVGMAQSPDQGFALEQARLDARTFIAEQVEITVQSAVERYHEQYNSTEDTATLAYRANFKELTRNLVDQSLNNVLVSDQKMYEVTSGDRNVYEAHVVMTLRRDDLLNVLDTTDDKASDDDTLLHTNDDRRKFREVFEQQMQQVRQNEPNH